MVDIDRPWIVDSTPSTRFPVYTRGNAGEVASKVTSPLQWTTISGPPAEREWRRALVEFGAFDEDEFRSGEMDVEALFHGYIYLNLSVSRVFGVRMPGASPELMDRTYLGESRGVRPYEPHPDDDAPQFAERIAETVKAIFATESRDDLEDDARMAECLRRERPNLTDLSSQELVERHKTLMSEYYFPTQRKHLKMIYESSVVTGLLDQALEPFEDETLAVRLLGGWGEVASAAASTGLWELSRLVTASDQLKAAFDEDVKGLLVRLREIDSEESRAFLRRFDDFLFRFGSRSTDEWAPLPPAWETHPEIALGLIDRMRLQPEDRAPQLQQRRLARQREELTAELRSRLSNDEEALATFDQAMKAISVWLPARELSKSNVIRILHEARLPFRVIGERMVEAGDLESLEDILMVTIDELEQLIENPSAFRETIKERREWAQALEELEPPFIIDGEIPPPSTWAKKTEPAVSLAAPGDILSGVAGCPGSATGLARIIRDPADASDLEPGEILIAPVTDPGWTPLFSSADAVVVDVGSPLSHAAIVSRELGIPCVLGVEQSTKRIKDGTLVTVDGTAGTVTVH